MDLIQLIIVIVVIGLVLWLVNSFIPMDPRLKSIVNMAVIIFVVLFLIIALLNFAGIGHMRVLGR